MAELYADVRAFATEGPEIAWQHWLETRERLYRTHPQSPVPMADRPTFRVRHWAYDPALRFELPLEADARAPSAADWSGSTLAEPPAPITLPNSGAKVLAFRRIGRLTVPFSSGAQSLSLFWMDGYAGGLFLPFRDDTNGTETYGAGRYVLDSAKSADLGGDPGQGMLVVDFNFAYQPSCAFDPAWACPLAPPENRLDVPIRAGERLV